MGTIWKIMWTGSQKKGSEQQIRLSTKAYSVKSNHLFYFILLLQVNVCLHELCADQVGKPSKSVCKPNTLICSYFYNTTVHLSFSLAVAPCLSLMSSPCFFLCSQTNRRRKWIYMQICLMRRPLCFLWLWRKSTEKSWVKDSSYRLLPGY